jgi:hypothetical protein
LGIELGRQDQKWFCLPYDAVTGDLAVDSNVGWKGPDKYVATVPQIFDLWQDPQERYDLFMNNFTERTWTLVTFNKEMRDLVKTHLEYPARKLQSEVEDWHVQ